MINSIVRNSSDGTDGAFMSASIIAILWSASSGSAAVIRGINKAYDFPLKRNYFFMRIKGLFFTVALMISMQFIFAAVFVGGRVIEFFCCMNSYSGVLFPLIDILRYAAAFLLLFVLFILTYKFLPYERIRFRQALPGAIFSAAGFIAGSYFFSSYINTRMEYYYNIYGSLSSVFVLLLWIYISSMIFLTGAEINASIKYCK
jgi:membrane protein